MARFRERRIRPVDPAPVRSVGELVRALSGCGFQGRKLAHSVDVWEAMCSEEACLKVLTLAGAMVPAGMGEVIMRLVEAKAVDVIVSTGANVSHDLVNAVVEAAQGHFQGWEGEDDNELRRHLVNRIFDVYIPEDQYEAAQAFLARVVAETELEGKVLSTAEFTRLLGGLVPHRSVLKVAAAHGVPLYVPAISDSELGLALTKMRRSGRRVSFDELGDVDHFARLMSEYRTAGCVVVGGGVPRNWAQQVFPYLDHLTRPAPRDRLLGYDFGVRITTDRPDFGGLSGCTFEESKSWGKYSSQARYATVICDATIALPLIAAALLERLDGRQRSVP